MASETSDTAVPAESRPLDFDAVYEAEFDFVYRVVSRLAGGEDIDDLVQEVFLVVHRRLSEFRGDARVTTWLFRIAHRVVGAHVRRARLRRRLLTVFGLEPQAVVARPGEEDDESARVRGSLERLPFKKRTVLVLHEVEGWTCEEIARELEVPLGTVHTRLFHARSAFRREYERDLNREKAR